MTRTLLTGNGAAAWAARLADVDYVPAFPITPQTEIIERLAAWIEAGEMPGRLTLLESEHSMITAAGSAAATGARVFTATSSQGLLHGMEMLFTVSGWRAPFVLVNVSRGLASPITLEPDHNDVLAARDSGFVQLHCATCQEVLDGVLLGYRIGEDGRVRLPVLVNLDGFYLSFTREPVSIPSADQVAGFLPPFDPRLPRFRAHDPQSHAVAVLGGALYSYFRYQVHLAQQRALQVFDEAAEDFAAQFGRRYGAVEAYRMEDAEVALLMIGSFATKARGAVDHLRRAGRQVGLLRPRLLRPFPAEALCRHLAGVGGLAVIDQNLSPGLGGILHAEVARALRGLGRDGPRLVSVIGGLGGRDIGLDELVAIADKTERAVETEVDPPPLLLFTEQELRQVRHQQAVAGMGTRWLDRFDEDTSRE